MICKNCRDGIHWRCPNVVDVNNPRGFRCVWSTIPTVHRPTACFCQHRKDVFKPEDYDYSNRSED